MKLRGIISKEDLHLVIAALILVLAGTSIFQVSNKVQGNAKTLEYNKKLIEQSKDLLDLNHALMLDIKNGVRGR